MRCVPDKRVRDTRVRDMRAPGSTPHASDTLVPRASDVALARQTQRHERDVGMPRAAEGETSRERPSRSHRLRAALGPRRNRSARPSRLARTLMAISLAVPMSAGMATFTPLAAQDQAARPGSGQTETAAGPNGASKSDKGSAAVDDSRPEPQQLIIQPDELTLTLGDKQTLTSWICAVGDGDPRGPDEEPGTDDDTCSAAKATTWSVRDAGAASFAPDHGKKVRLSADAIIAQTVIMADVGDLSATATLAIDDVASAQEPAKPPKKAAESKSQGKKAEAQGRKKEPAKPTTAPSKPAPQAPAKRSTKEPPPAVKQAETQRAEEANDQGPNTKAPAGNVTKDTPSPTVATEPFIVTFESGTGKARQGDVIERAGGKPGRAIGRLDMRRVELPRSNRAKALAELRSDPSVRSVDPDYRRKVNAGPERSGLRATVEPFGGPGGHPLGRGLGRRQLPHRRPRPPSPSSTRASIPRIPTSTAWSTALPATPMVTAPGWPASRPQKRNQRHPGIAGVAYDGVRILPITVIGADGYGYDSDIIGGIEEAID